LLELLPIFYEFIVVKNNDDYCNIIIRIMHLLIKLIALVLCAPPQVRLIPQEQTIIIIQIIIIISLNYVLALIIICVVIIKELIIRI